MIAAVVILAAVAALLAVALLRSRAAARGYRRQLDDLPREIIDRQRAERELELAEVNRQLMVEVMNDAYVAIDSDGLVTDWNERASTMFGFSKEEAIGRAATELIIPPEDHGEFDTLIERFLRGERQDRRLDLRVDRTAVRKDGSRLTVELAAATLAHRGRVSLHTFMHDVTDRRITEAEAKARAADVEALAEATGALARSTVPEEARAAVCHAASEVSGATVAILFEPDPDGGALRVTAASGARVVGEELPLGRQSSGASRAFDERRPRFVAELGADPEVDQEMVRRTGTASAYWVPVIRGDATLGVIAVAWRESRVEVGTRVERMLSLIAAEAAVAIERVGMLDRLTTIARTDDLTGLPNRRAWDHELEREMARARRRDSPLAIAMLDLDHFKAYNDEHGHQAGDLVLKQAATAWRGVLRESDLLARYGGEEFSVALPTCDGEAALKLIERLRGVTPGGQSCSAGLAVWDGGESAELLVGRADRALYEAKRAGRDRTVTA